MFVKNNFEKFTLNRFTSNTHKKTGQLTLNLLSKLHKFTDSEWKFLVIITW